MVKGTTCVGDVLRLQVGAGETLWEKEVAQQLSVPGGIHPWAAQSGSAGLMQGGLSDCTEGQRSIRTVGAWWEMRPVRQAWTWPWLR